MHRIGFPKDSLKGDFLIIAGSVVIAAFSLLLDSAIGSDPAHWVLWGRQIDSLSLRTWETWTTWKPLPTIFTSVYGLTGDHARNLWIMTARAACFASAGVAYRLTVDLTNQAFLKANIKVRFAPQVGGVLAGLWIFTLTAVPEIHGFMFGFGEGMLVLLCLLAVQQWIDGKLRMALLFGLLASLSRPEILAAVALLVLLNWRARPDLRLLSIGGVVVVLFAWFGIDWMGSGDPLHTTHLAASWKNVPTGFPGDENPMIMPQLAVEEMPLLCLFLLPLGVGASIWAYRLRLRAPMFILAGGLAWVAVITLMTVLGNSGIGRYMVNPDAFLAILSGFGTSVVVGLFAASLRKRQGVLRKAAVLPVVLGIGLVIAEVAVNTVPLVRDEIKMGKAQKFKDDTLREAIDLAGGPEKVKACGPIGRTTMEGTIAWFVDGNMEDFSTIHSPASYAKSSGHKPPPPKVGMMLGIIPVGTTFTRYTRAPKDRKAFISRIENGHLRKNSSVRYVGSVGQWDVWQYCPGAPKPS